MTIACLLLLAACGKSEPYAPQTVETQRAWEGIGIWGVPEDTATMTTIRGEVIATPNLAHVSNGLRWTVRSVEEIDRGIARTWPGTDNLWIAVRLDLNLEFPPSLDTATIATPVPRSVILREQVVLLDREGGRHLPMQVHDRIIPPIDRPIMVDTPGFQAVLVFALHRGGTPAALEIHDPLGDARLTWTPEAAPTSWISVQRTTILTDGTQRAIWEAQLRRVRLADGEFTAEISLRNVTAERRAIPSTAEARIYTGGGRTIQSVTPERMRMLEPGRSVSLSLQFTDVPRRESLELILPAGDRLIRFDALPGLHPEEAMPLHRPTVSEGIQASVLGTRRDSELQVRFGLLNLTDAPISLAGLLVEALLPGGAQPAGLVAPPPVLWPDFEERRWTVGLPTSVQALRIVIPGRSAFIIKI